MTTRQQPQLQPNVAIILFSPISSDMNNNENTGDRPHMLGAFPSFRRANNDTDDNSLYFSTTTTTTTGGEQASTPPSFVREEQALSTTGAVILEDNDDENKDEAHSNTCRRWLFCIAFLGAFIVAICVVIVIWWMISTENSVDKRFDDVGTLPTPMPTLSPSTIPTYTTAGTAGFAKGYPTWKPTTIPPSMSSFPTTFPPSMAVVAEQLSALLGLQIPLDDHDSSYYKAVDWMANVDQILPTEANATSMNFRYSRRLAQRFVLSLLYYSTGGASSWKDNCSFLDPQLHECEWKCVDTANSNNTSSLSTEDVELLANKGILTNKLGVYCYDFPGFEDEIQHLILVDNGMNGSLPTELRELIALRSLWLFHNNLTGSIPDSLVANHFLEEVRLEHNQLTGNPLPWSQMSYLSQMRDWRAHRNSLSGSLSTFEPAEQLETLDLSWNSLTGILPSDLWDPSNLKRVSLTGNELEGPLPDSLGTSVQLVYLGNNGLTGTLPTDLVASSDLILLNLRDNKFSGDVPSNWFTTTNNLIFLDLSGNVNLTGNLDLYCANRRTGKVVFTTCAALPCSCCVCIPI